VWQERFERQLRQPGLLGIDEDGTAGPHWVSGLQPLGPHRQRAG
jgi:hypothetical protein